MLHFGSDYLEGAHPNILELLVNTNMEQTIGYSEDHYSNQAAQLIKQACQAPQAAVHFMVGGTQTNATAIASLLKPYQGVLCAQSAHIAVHETGAIEATGHKVLTLPSGNGKITAAQIAHAISSHYNDGAAEHMVQPGMVYISQPTETGTLYSLLELQAIRSVCNEYHIPLYADGARMAYALMAQGNDVELPQMAALTDIFYIGGTKVGALFGEAVVINNPAFQKGFRYMMKRQGALLAKGRLLGLQFMALFQDQLYQKLGKNATSTADKLRLGLLKLNFELVYQNPTNQVFVPLSIDTAMKLKEHVGFEIWETINEQEVIVRFCTSWATTSAHVETLLQLMEEITVNSQ